MKRFLVVPEWTKDWEKNGKGNATELWSTLKDETAEAFQFLREILDAALSKDISIANATDFLMKLLSGYESSSSKKKIFQSCVSDSLWHAGVENESKSQSEKRTFVYLIKGIAGQEIVPRAMLKERLEIDLLKECGLIEDVFRINQIRMNTRLFYTQSKFNLLREESEGYAKLVTELIEGDEILPDKLGDVVSTMHALIGQFDLDPNRVLAIVLDSFEVNLENDCYLKLVSEFRGPNLPHILGFKFQSNKELKEMPQSLFSMAARLIKAELVTIQQLYPHLSPSDQDSKADHDKESNMMLESAKNLGVVNLASRPSIEDSQQNVLEKEASEKAVETTLQEIKDRKASNQKLSLLVALLDARALKPVEFLLDILRPIDPCSYAPVANAMANFVSEMIHPLYHKIAPAGSHPLPGRSNADLSKIECRAYPHLVSRLYAIIRHLGIYLSGDIVLFVKLCRVMKAWGESGIAREYVDRSLKLIADVLLPALTQIPTNPAAANELNEVLKTFSWQFRYRCYSQFEVSFSSLHPLVVSSRTQAEIETKKIMRRLAKENVRHYGRKLCKVSHSDPLTCLGIIVDQLQAYENMILPVVEALRFLSPLSYDMLSYLIVKNLGSPLKPMLKPDGTNLSKWLLSVSLLCGHLYSKYPQKIELSGLLQYILSQLKDGSSYELIVLKELVTKMAGIESSEENVSEQQLNAMGGGSILRAEASVFIAPSGKPVKKSSQALVDVLAKNRLAVPLVIAIAQTRSSIIFNSETNHLKLVGDLYDKCHETLIQFVEFLEKNSKDPEVYSNGMPQLIDLFKNYHLQPEAAFFVARPALKILTGESHLDVVRNLLPDSAWLRLSPLVYHTFWSLTLQDITVPTSKYESTILQHKQAIEQLDQQSRSKESVIQGYMNPEEQKFEQKRREKEKDGHLSIIKKLEEELQEQKQNQIAVTRKMSSQKDSWFEGVELGVPSIVEFLQDCVLPRCTFSTSDALYAAHFVRLIHKLGTPNFSTVHYCDQVLKDITAMVFCCTESEASRLGLFLNETLAMISRWKSDAKAYEKECHGKPGFLDTHDTNSGEGAKPVYISRSDFLKVDFRWQKKLTGAFTSCLESSEYMEIRNALVVLTKIVQLFPKVVSHYNQIEDRVLKFREESREDLKVLAARYHALLQLQKNSLKQDEDFLPFSRRSKKADKEKDEKEKEHSSSRDRSKRDRSRSRVSESPRREGENEPRSSSKPPLTPVMGSAKSRLGPLGSRLAAPDRYRHRDSSEHSPLRLEDKSEKAKSHHRSRSVESRGPETARVSESVTARVVAKLKTIEEQNETEPAPSRESGASKRKREPDSHDEERKMLKKKQEEDASRASKHKDVDRNREKGTRTKDRREKDKKEKDHKTRKSKETEKTEEKKEEEKPKVTDAEKKERRRSRTDDKPKASDGEKKERRSSRTDEKKEEIPKATDPVKKERRSSRDPPRKAKTEETESTYTPMEEVIKDEPISTNIEPEKPASKRRKLKRDGVSSGVLDEKPIKEEKEPDNRRVPEPFRASTRDSSSGSGRRRRSGRS